MGSADPTLGARIVCVDGSDAEPRLLRSTLVDVLRGTSYVASIRVHARESLTDLAADTRLEWRPPLAAGLVDTLQQLPPDAGDVLYVSAGVRLPAAWDARLAAAAALDARVGCVSPLCDGMPPYTAVGSASQPSLEDVAHQDRLLAELGADRHLQVDTFLPLCVYLRGAAVAALRAAAAAPATALDRAGLVSLLATNLLISVDGEKPAVDRLRDYVYRAGEYVAHIAPLRDAVTARRRPPARPSRRPVQLHVAHSWGGGLGQWVDNFIQGDTERENLVLKSIGTWGAFGQRIELYAPAAGTTAVRAWSLASPISASAPAHLEYRALLREIIADYGVEAVIVSSLIGHSFDALRTGLPTLLVAHDHYPFCITLYAYFDDVCSTCDGGRLRRCIAGNPLHAFFRNIEADEWEALRDCFVEAVRGNPVTLVAPGRSVLERWRRQMPALVGVPAAVVPHGTDLPESPPLAGADAERLRLVLLGSLFAAKGLGILEEALEALLEVADVYLLGCGETGAAFEGRRGVFVVRRYARSELAGHLAEIRPHLGLLLSVVPETYSYTLSELWHFGIPVLATRLGSFLDRIEDGRNGFLVEPTAAALIAAVRSIDGQRGRLAAVREVLVRQAGRDLDAMVRDYRALLPLAPGRAAAHCSIRATGDLIQVNPDATYAQALRAFVAYSLAKVRASPRLPAWLRTSARVARQARRTLTSRRDWH